MSSTGIANGQGIVSRPMDPPAGFPGAAATTRGLDARAMANPKRKQVTTVSVGGTATNGDYSTTITLPSGDQVTVTTTRTGGSPSSNANIATQHATDIEAAAGLLGHVESAEASSTDVVITFAQPGKTYTVAHAAPSPGTLTSALTTSSSGSSIPVGRFVMRSSSYDGVPGCALPNSSTASIAGVSMRPHGKLENSSSEDPDAVPSWPAGTIVDVAHTGCIFVENVGAAASEGGDVYTVISTTGGDALGEVRGDADGVEQVTTLTPGAGQNSVEISVLITITAGEHAGKSFTLSTLSDGSMTATEVCDAWRTMLNADAFWSTLLVDSGTATLVLTAADPTVQFDATNVQGTVTIAATTAGALYTKKVDGAKWHRDCASGAVGVLKLAI